MQHGCAWLLPHGGACAPRCARCCMRSHCCTHTQTQRWVLSRARYYFFLSFFLSFFLFFPFKLLSFFPLPPLPSPPTPSPPRCFHYARGEACARRAAVQRRHRGMHGPRAVPCIGAARGLGHSQGTAPALFTKWDRASGAQRAPQCPWLTLGSGKS